MKKRYSNKYKKEIYEIFAGEYYVTKNNNIILQTLLGSCVAVCLHDRYAKVTGINHFMLPGKPNFDVKKNIYDEDCRYGKYAMELLINSMIKKGAIRENLEAKIFGGGEVIKNGRLNVAKNNIKFILAYLKTNDIPVKSQDIGKDYGRKIIILPDSFNIYLKKIKISKIKNTIKQEKILYNKIHSTIKRKRITSLNRCVTLSGKEGNK